MKREVHNGSIDSLEERVLQLNTRYKAEFEKLFTVYNYTNCQFTYPLDVDELEYLLSNFKTFEKLLEKERISLPMIGSIAPEIRKKILANLGVASRLVLEAKIPLREIPGILSNYAKHPGMLLFECVNEICQLVTAGINWNEFYNWDEIVKNTIILQADLLYTLITQKQMPCEMFSALPSIKKRAFMNAIFGVKCLIQNDKITWDIIFALDEHHYPIISRHSIKFNLLFEIGPVTLDFLLSQPPEALKFLSDNAEIIVTFLKYSATSIDELLEFDTKDRNFLVKNSIDIPMFTGDPCHISVAEIVSLDNEERNFLIKYERQAISMHHSRNSNKNPEDRAVNLPPEGVNRARWTVDELKKYLQPDGTFKGLAGKQTPKEIVRASPTPNLSTPQPKEVIPFKPKRSAQPPRRPGDDPVGSVCDAAFVTLCQYYGSMPRYTPIQPKSFKLTKTQKALLGTGAGMTLLGGGLWIAFAAGALTPEALGSSAAIATFLTVAWPAAIGLVAVGASLVIATSIYAYTKHRCDNQPESINVRYTA